MARNDLADRHLVLIGLMGSGKTTVGRIVAERLRRPFVDTDAEIERIDGRTVRAIFAEDGEPAFREIEAAVLAAALASAKPAVIAAAGGVVLSAANRAELGSGRCRVVWLLADPAALLVRVQHGGHRPLLDGDAEAALLKMAAEREPLYRQSADAIVCVDGRNLQDVVEAVLR
jgi:shikimate kinase